SIFAGKHDIEDNCVEILPLAIVPQKQLQRALAISRNFNRMPFGFEIELQPLGEMGFVFDDEHSAHAVLLGSSKTTVVPRPSPSAFLLVRKRPRVRLNTSPHYRERRKQRYSIPLNRPKPLAQLREAALAAAPLSQADGSPAPRPHIPAPVGQNPQ